MKKDLTKKIMWTVGLGVLILISFYLSVISIKYIVNSGVYIKNTIKSTQDLNIINSTIKSINYNVFINILHIIVLFSSTVFNIVVMVKIWKNKKGKTLA